MKKIPIGISSFKKIIEDDYYFVDKSLFIKEVVDSGAQVTLVARPRRFGKTLNLSMLQYFFELPVGGDGDGDKEHNGSNAHLFDNLLVSRHPEIMEHQGKYPVIALTFKDIKQNNWKDCYDRIKKLISVEFRRHDYLVKSGLLDEVQKKQFNSVIDLSASNAIYEDSLRDLSEHLFKFHKKSAIILIDEYDAPIQSGFIEGYYDDVISFMRGFLSAGLKDNKYLHLSVMTGIMRIAKESIFSGLNNLNVCTLLGVEFADKFGLTQDEVEKMLEYYNASEFKERVKEWYDGYASLGIAHLYNPWSIINFLGKGRIFNPYWINASNNDIIKDLVQQGGLDLKSEFEKLLNDQVTVQDLEENIVFQSLKTSTSVVWNFMLATGYLTFRKSWLDGIDYKVELAIPNLEVKRFFRATVLSWFCQEIPESNYNRMLSNLAAGDVSQFKKDFKVLAVNSLSCFDVGGQEPERFYHALVLGMLVSLEKTHRVKSNRESGFGRYDVMLIPKDVSKPGVVIEFKKIDLDENETLETAADAALEQIENKNYAAELHELGIKKIIKIGIAFEGKKVLVKDR